jgi:hypothetical protein
MPSYPPLRNVEGAEYEQPIDQNTEGVAAKGFYPQGAATSGDETVGIERDGSGNLVLKDGTTGTKTLGQIAAASSGPSNYDFLLESDPDAVNNDYTITRTSGVVTKETWIRRADSKTMKTIDYTRSSGLLTEELIKLYASDGTTVVAQLRVTYTRSGGVVVSATRDREI